MNEQNLAREIFIWVLVAIAAILILATLFNPAVPRWTAIIGIVFLALSWLARALIPKKIKTSP